LKYFSTLGLSSSYHSHSTFLVFTMANNNEMKMFVIENIEQHERFIHVRQSRNPEFITDPFTYTDRLFIKNYKVTK